MFKGLAGLKKVVKGGISAVAETSSDLAEKVYADPTTSQGHLKENLKKKVQGVVEGSEHIASEAHAKEGAAEVAKAFKQVKHYGGFTEDFLGYEDPNKDLRKAVKAKEKAAKKARKAKKKKTGKKEDLFDPENLAKFKLELDERKKREAEFKESQVEADDLAIVADLKDSDEEPRPGQEPEQEPDFKFTLELESNKSSANQSVAHTPCLQSPLAPIKAHDTDDWKLFQSLTAGADALIKKKTEDLDDIKQDSYFQRKPDPVTLESSETTAESRAADRKKKKGKGKNWVHPFKADIEGSFSGTDDEDEEEEEDHKTEEEAAAAEEDKSKDEKKEDDIGLVEIPDDEPYSDEEDIFNTGFVDAITSGDVKLAVIPDDPVYDDNEDDPFNTNFADAIVNKDKLEKRKESNRLKFVGLSSVADVLTGKTDKVDKGLIEHSTKRKRRRANRINLIGGEDTELTAREDIGFEAAIVSTDILTTTQEDQAPDLLASTSAPVNVERKEDLGALVDFSAIREFEEFEFKKDTQLTSNVAILAGEFATAIEEEVDDFDAAFDALAQESVTRGKIEELEKQFEDSDVFDTTCADTVLNLASLTNKVEEVEEPLDDFEDRDPFDTTAYDDITGDLETDLDFDSLAKRDPDQEQEFRTTKKTDIDEEFSGWTEVQPVVDQGWAAFQETKTEKKPPPRPSKPPPPRPPRPSRGPPSTSTVHLNPEDNPAIVLKAPSLESIKSWNCATADILIKKSQIEALDAPEEEQDEEDPFDTSNFDGIVETIKEDDPFDVSGFKSPEAEKASPVEEEKEIEDPFDLSGFKSPEPEEQPDLLTNLGDDEDICDVPIALAPATVVEKDPFDTEFATGVLPDKGDPFDTSYVKGGPGKAEIKALEEEFLTQEPEFDPRTEEAPTTKSKVYAGQAGRARPAKRGPQSELIVKAPEVEEDEVDDDEVDPFDTTIVDKILPVRPATKSSDIAIEDDQFDPTSTFQDGKEEVDPFDTTIAGEVIPELAEKVPEKKSEPTTPEIEEKTLEKEVVESPLKEEVDPFDTTITEVKTVRPEDQIVPQKPKLVDEVARKYGRARPKKPIVKQISDDDFDPRA